MKTATVTFGFIMLVIVQLWAIIAFTVIWGGVGFFGSLLTIPLSGLVYVIMSMFTSFGAFIGWVIYLGVAAVLIGQGE